MKPENNTKTVNNEETELKTGTKPASESKSQNGKSSFWQSVLVGGVPGILIGASSAEAVEAVAAQHEPIEDPENPVTSETIEIQVAHSVNDDMSFSEAFAAARAEVGPGGAFVWHGNVYGTYRADDPEWLEMTSEERMEHSQLIMSQVHRVPYEPTNHEPKIEPNPNAPENNHNDEASHNGNPSHNDEGNDNAGENGEANQNVGSTDESNGEVDVHIVGVGQVVTEEGDVVQVGFGEVEGHEAIFADADGDGEVDTVLIDENDNGEVDVDEVYDAEGSGLTMEALAAEAEANSAETLDDQLYTDMPDYTNDADTSSLV